MTESAAEEILSPVSFSTPQRDVRSLGGTQERDVPRDADPTINTFQRDERTDGLVMSCTTQQDQPSDVQSKRDLSNDVDHISHCDEPKVTQSPSSPQHDAPSDVNHLSDTSQHDGTSDINVRDVSHDFISVFEDDAQSTWTSMSNFTTPMGWELMPRELQKKLKGQEFLKRLKQSINNDEDTDEK